jgi:hypothetical protein
MTLIVDVDINLLKNCTNTAASTPWRIADMTCIV